MSRAGYDEIVPRAREDGVVAAAGVDPLAGHAGDGAGFESVVAGEKLHINRADACRVVAFFIDADLELDRGPFDGESDNVGFVGPADLQDRTDQRKRFIDERAGVDNSDRAVMAFDGDREGQGSGVGIGMRAENTERVVGPGSNLTSLGVKWPPPPV